MASRVEEKLSQVYSSKIIDIYTFKGDLNVVISRDDVIEICRFLKTDDELKFNFLSCITAADYLGKRDQRFEVVYILYSIPNKHRVIIKIRVNENNEVPSLTSLWSTADFQEREVYDMFGIKFSGHPNLTRILMDDDWIGHPQRKDFPLTYEAPHFSHNRDDKDTYKKAPWRGDD